MPSLTYQPTHSPQRKEHILDACYKSAWYLTCSYLLCALIY
nr:MAG TPA: hypothetical protein [Caudoviricetes sp.]